MVTGQPRNCTSSPFTMAIVAMTVTQPEVVTALFKSEMCTTFHVPSASSVISTRTMLPTLMPSSITVSGVTLSEKPSTTHGSMVVTLPINMTVGVVCVVASLMEYATQVLPSRTTPVTFTRSPVFKPASMVVDSRVSSVTPPTFHGSIPCTSPTSSKVGSPPTEVWSALPPCTFTTSLSKWSVTPSEFDCAPLIIQASMKVTSPKCPASNFQRTIDLSFVFIATSRKEYC